MHNAHVVHLARCICVEWFMLTRLKCHISDITILYITEYEQSGTVSEEQSCFDIHLYNAIKISLLLSVNLLINVFFIIILYILAVERFCFHMELSAFDFIWICLLLSAFVFIWNCLLLTLFDIVCFWDTIELTTFATFVPLGHMTIYYLSAAGSDSDPGSLRDSGEPSISDGHSLTTCNFFVM